MTEDVAFTSQEHENKPEAVENAALEADEANLPVAPSRDQVLTCNTEENTDATQKTALQQKPPSAEKAVQEAKCPQELPGADFEGSDDSQRKAGWGSISTWWPSGSSSNIPATQLKEHASEEPASTRREPAAPAEDQDQGHICFKGTPQALLD